MVFRKITLLQLRNFIKYSKKEIVYQTFECHIYKIQKVKNSHKL